MKNVRILKVAYKDLAAGKRFYDRQESGVGDYFIDSLISDIDSLKIHAGIHKKIFDHHKFNSKRFPYAIYYKMSGDTAVVRRILDMRRDPEKTAKKIGKIK